MSPSGRRRAAPAPPAPAAPRAAAREVVAPTGTHARIHAVVRRIPRGRVATYGQVATLAGVPGQARLVGYALAALAGTTTVPWHRVINAQGRVSARADGAGASVTQRLLLEREGVAFLAGRVDLERFRWQPPAANGDSARRGSGRGRGAGRGGGRSA